MVATAIYSVTMALWKETAFPLCRAMERRWKRNIISRVSSVIVVIRLSVIDGRNWREFYIAELIFTCVPKHFGPLAGRRAIGPIGALWVRRRVKQTRFQFLFESVP